MVRAIFHKWKKLGMVVNHPMRGQATTMTQWAHQRLIQETTKEPRTTSKELQTYLLTDKVIFQYSTIKKRDWHWHWLTFAKKNRHQNKLMIAKNFGKVICGVTRQTLNFLEGLQFVTLAIKLTQHLTENNLVTRFKDGGNLMTWMTCYN